MTIVDGADPQAQYDAEDDAFFKRRLRTLREDLRTRRREEAEAGRKLRGASKRWKRAQAKLEAALDEPTHGGEYRRRLHELAAQEDACMLERLEARQNARKAAEKRALAQDELRAAIRADRQPCPLFDRKEVRP